MHTSLTRTSVEVCPWEKRIELPAGSLEVFERPGSPERFGGPSYRLADLCDFAARANPRRGFLFVPRPLGRYLPVRPRRLRQVAADLTANIPNDLPGPVVVFGVAEAGIALALEVFGHLHARTGRDDLMFLHSSRRRTDRPIAFQYREPHSHAPEHQVYLPESPALRQRCEAAQTLIVVDDEITSGRTFGALAAAWKRRYPAVRRIVHPVLTDWSRQPLSRTVSIPGVECSCVSLARGLYQWTSNGRPVSEHAARASRNDSVLPPGTNGGRFGLASPIEPPSVPVGGARRILVLGTGELQAEPLACAHHLEGLGHDVHFALTTRAPVLPGHAIRHIREVGDIGERVRHFIYNVLPGAYDRVIFFHEHPDGDAFRPSALEGFDVVSIGR